MRSNYSSEAIRKTAEFLLDACHIGPDWSFVDERPRRQIEAAKVFFDNCTENERHEIVVEALDDKTRDLVNMKTMDKFWLIIEAYLERTIDDDVTDIVWEIKKKQGQAA